MTLLREAHAEYPAMLTYAKVRVYRLDREYTCIARAHAHALHMHWSEVVSTTK